MSEPKSQITNGSEETSSPRVDISQLMEILDEFDDQEEECTDFPDCSNSEDESSHEKSEKDQLIDQLIDLTLSSDRSTINELFDEIPGELDRWTDFKIKSFLDWNRDNNKNKTMRRMCDILSVVYGNMDHVSKVDDPDVKGKVNNVVSQFNAQQTIVKKKFVQLVDEDDKWESDSEIPVLRSFLYTTEVSMIESMIEAYYII